MKKKQIDKSKINIELVSIIIEQKDYPFERGFFLRKDRKQKDRQNKKDTNIFEIK